MCLLSWIRTTQILLVLLESCTVLLLLHSQSRVGNDVLLGIRFLVDQ